MSGLEDDDVFEYGLANQVVGCTGHARVHKSFSASKMYFNPRPDDDLDSLKEKTNAYIHAWTKGRVRDSKAIDVITTLLTKKRWVTVVGFPGEGKTTLGCFVLEEMKQMKECSMEVYVIQSPEDYDIALSQSPQSVMMFNDLLGTFALDPTAFSKWRRVLARLLFSHSEEREKGYILFIGGLNVIKEVQEQFARSESFVLIYDLFNYSDEIANNKEVKEQIFDYHLGKLAIKVSTKDQICSKVYPFGFSHTCKMYAQLMRSENDLQIGIQEFFKNPTQYLELPMRNLFKGEVNRDLLQKILKAGGSIDLNDVEDDIQRLKLREAEEKLRGNYLKRDGHLTTFTHQLIYASVAFSIGRLDPLFVIKYCSISFIMQKVKIIRVDEKENSKAYDYLYLDMKSPAIYKTLLKRFAKDLRQKQFGVLDYSACKIEDFLKELLSQVILKGDDDTVVSDDTSPGRILVDDMDEGESTMLLVVARSGNTTAVRVLLEFGAQTDIKSCLHRRTALHYLSMKDKFDESIIDHLVDHGGNINEVDKDGNTALHYMCREGKLGLSHYKKLIDRGIDVNKRNNFGESALHMVCGTIMTKVYERNDHPECPCKIEEIVTLLIKNGASVMTSDKHERVPLHFFCKNGNFNQDIMGLLINFETVNKKDIDGRTALHHLCESETCNPDLVLKLVSSGANVNAKDKDGKTALHFACDKKIPDFRLLDILTEKEANIRLTDAKSKIPFQYLCNDGKAEVAIINFLTTKVDTVTFSVTDADVEPQVLSGKSKALLSMLLSKEEDIRITIKDGRVDLQIITEKTLKW